MLENLDSDKLLPWVAGFWEGEGHVGTYYSNFIYHMKWAVSQKNREPLEVVLRWLDSLGIKAKIYNIKQASMGNITVTRYADVCKIVQELMPYLSTQRQEQIDEALMEMEENSPMARALMTT